MEYVEGGKVMKVKIFFKVLFILTLVFVFCFFIYIIYVKIDTNYNSSLLSTYTIFYDNNTDECTSSPEILYSDNEYNYSLSCVSSYNTYLLWDDGTKELLKNALDNNKVDIKSLENHGLKIIKNGK